MSRRILVVLVLQAVLLWCSCASDSSCRPRADVPELELLWQLPTPWAWLRTPASVDTTFYLMIEHGKLSQMSARDGRILREVRPEQPGSYEGPVVDGTSIFLSCGNSNICSFDLASLTLLWSTYVYPPDSTGPCGMHIEFGLSQPVVDPSRIFFTSGDGNLYCLDRTSGLLKWRLPLGEISAAAPLLLNGTVYAAGFDSCLSAVEPTTGDLLWRIQLGEAVEYTQPKAVGSLIYGAGTCGSVFCVDSDSRSFRWKRKVGTRFRGQISASEDLICAADASGIYGLDPATGATEWRHEMAGHGPIQANGRIYCFSSDQGLLVLEMKSGAILASYPVGLLGFFNEPLIVQDLIIAPVRGNIYCFADITD